MSTLRHHLWRCLRLKLAVFAIFAAFSVPYAFASDPAPVVPDLPHPAPAEIIAFQHDCWTGNAPADMAGKMPGAMVTIDAHYVDNPARVRRALDRALAGQHSEAFAFCRGGLR